MTPLKLAGQRVMPVSAVLALALALASSACKRATDPDTTRPLDIPLPELRSALGAREQSLQKTRTELRLSDGAVVTICEGYLKARQAGVRVAEAVEAQLVMSEYLVCDALQALSTAVPAASSSPSTRGEQLAERLDLRSFPSSRGPRVDESKHTLQALGDHVTVTAVAASVEDDTWNYQLRIVAEADFDGDDKPDWLVWLTDEARSEGNYRGYSTLLISNVDAPGPLLAKEYP